MKYDEKIERVLMVINAATDNRPVYPAAPRLPSDFEWGLIDQRILERLKNAKFLCAYRMGEPIRLTAKGRKRMLSAVSSAA